MRHKLFAGVLLLAALMGAALTTMACTAQAEDHAKPAQASHDGAGRIEHVFVIMLENHSAAGVIGDKHTPYITSLADNYASASKYYGVTHPSLPNYVALLSGSNWWVNDDKADNHFDHTNLVDQLEAAHKSWAGYMEALPVDDKLVDSWPGGQQKLYSAKHNPFVRFDNIRSNPARLAHVKPYTDFAADLASEETTPNFALISPDQCNDMHGGVTAAVPGHPETPCGFNTDNADGGLKAKADAFVKGAVKTIMDSPAWKHSKSVIFVIADEGNYQAEAGPYGHWESAAGCCNAPVLPAKAHDISRDWPGGMYGGGLVPAIVMVSKGGKRGGYVSTEPYNHYSLLATIEGIWNLGLLGYASDTEQVKPMTEFLTR